MHDSNIFRIGCALRFDAVNRCLQLRRYCMEVSLGERATVVGAEIDQTLSFPVSPMGRKLSAEEFLCNIVRCHWCVGWYVLVDIVGYIRCCLHIKVLAQSSVVWRINDVISSQNIAMSTDECARASVGRRLVTATWRKCDALLWRKMDGQLGVDVREDAYDGRPGHVDCTHHRITDIAARIPHCVGLRRDPDEANQREKRDSQRCYGMQQRVALTK